MRIQAKASSARSSERGSRVRSAWALGVAVLCASLLSGTSAALASDTYSPAGEFANGAFSSPGKIAVDSATGNVLVVDSGGNRVQVYDSGGSSATLLTTFGEGELSSPYGIAIDQGSGAVYVSDAGNSRVRRYLTNGAATPTYTLDGGYTSPAQGAEAEAGQIGSFFSPLAIDPGDGDLLIADTGNLHVSRFTSSGAFVSTFNGEGSEGGPFTSLMGLALDAGGDVYVVANGHIDGVTGAPSGSVVERFGPDGEAKERLGEVGALDGAVSIAVAPSNGHVLVATGGGSPGFGAPPALLHVYSDGDLLVTIAYPPQAAESTPAALAVDGAGSGRLYSLSDINGFFNSGARSVQVFKSIIAPELVLNAPTNVTATSVHLSGTVNSDGAINTHYHFDYSLDGGGSWTSTPQGDVGTTKAPQAVEADITGLAPNSKYLVRLVAFNDDISLDSLSTNFTTATSAPGVSTADATDRTSTNATLRGSLNPFGLQTTYHFEYGTSSAYGTRAPAAHEAIAGAGHKSLNVSLTVSGLQPETTYHYRLVADNSAGPEAGLDKTFITEAEGGSAAQRVYELASPEGQAATVLGEIGSKAAADGKGIVFASASPANSPETQTSARAVVYASLRSDQGWVTRALDPRTRGLLAFYTFSTIAVSDDLSHAVVTSDVALTPGAFEGGGNLYLRDVSTGGLTFIAGSADPNVFREFAQGFQADKFLGGSSDFSTVVFNCPIALMPDASEGVMNAYKWSVTGGLRLESKMPDGSAAVSNSQSSNRTGAELNRVSASGSVVAFGLEGDGVYARVDDNETIPLSISSIAGDPTTPHPGAAIWVTPEGRYAVFATWDDAPLTTDAPQRTGNMYRYDFETGELLYLGGTVGFSGLGVLEYYFIGAGQDAKYLYFGYEGKLWVSEEGTVRLVADLPGSTRRAISPSGRFLAFTGETSEVYLYDAQTEELSCASCPQDGSQSTGPAQFPSTEREFGNNELARAVTDAGEVFFDTPSKLVPVDVNGRRDVYAYRDGSVSLISPGNADYGATFMDASVSGGDVFFKTEQAIVPGAVKAGFNVYDARVGGGLNAPQSPPPGCTGDACQGSPALPVLASPVVAAGGGNVSARHSRCRKRGAVKQRNKRGCTKRHVGKNAGGKKSVRAGSTGRAGR